MKFHIKQKAFSFVDRFSIMDEFDQQVYTVEGKLWSWAKVLTIYENELPRVTIQQKLFSFMPRFEVFVDQQAPFVVAKRFAFFKNDYAIEGLGYDVSGDFFGHQYEVLKDGNSVATISKRYFKIADTYEVDINRSEDHLIVLAIVISIDAAIAISQRNTSTSK